MRQEGVISLYGSAEDVILAPDTVQVGEAFPVTVQTYGDGCTKADGMEFEVINDVAILTPYDRITIPGRNEACPLILVQPVHTSQIIFGEPGSATLRVKGMLRDAANPDGIMTTIEKTIRVE